MFKTSKATSHRDTPLDRDATQYRIVRLDPTPPRPEDRWDHNRPTTGLEDRRRARVARGDEAAWNAPPPARPRVRRRVEGGRDLLDVIEEREGERDDLRAMADYIHRLVLDVARTNVLATGREPSPENHWTPGTPEAWASLLLAEGYPPKVVALTLLLRWLRPRVSTPPVIADLAARADGWGLTIRNVAARGYSHGRRFVVAHDELRDRRETARLSRSALARRAAVLLLNESADAIRRQVERAEEKGAALPVDVYCAVSAALVEAEAAV